MYDESKIEFQAKVFQRDDGTFGFMTRMITPSIGFHRQDQYEQPWQEYPFAVCSSADAASGAMRLYLQMQQVSIQREVERMAQHLSSLASNPPKRPKHIIQD